MTSALGFHTQGGVNVNLGMGNDFVQSGRTSDGSNYPSGATLTLEIGVQGSLASWPATITGSTFAWNVDHSLIDPIVTAYKGQQVPTAVKYHDSTGADFVLCTGRVAW